MQQTIGLSFAAIKEKTYEDTIQKIFQMLSALYRKYDFLKGYGILSDSEMDFFEQMQIEEKHYAAALQSRGISSDRIRMYGFAFEGKTVLIG